MLQSSILTAGPAIQQFLYLRTLSVLLPACSELRGFRQAWATTEDRFADLDLDSRSSASALAGVWCSVMSATMSS